MIALSKLKVIAPRSLVQKQLCYTLCVMKTLNPTKPKGKLSIIPTPIGNLNDLTPNILKCLFKADLIGCEDRRVAGQLYTLIRNKNIIGKMEEHFGSLGLNAIIATDQTTQSFQFQDEQKIKEHQFYDYSNMTDKKRRKFLSKLTLQEQKQFKIDYLKYRAKKIVNKNQEFVLNKRQTGGDKFDELYGLEVSDFKHIEAQIMNTRAKKGRGLLIPLNTYSETKMYDLLKMLLQSKHIAIVSDAGMPCISDPGWKIIKMLRESMADVDIEVIGGPSAVDIMLTLSTMTQKNNSLSGRFQGFAAPQVSNITQQGINLNASLKVSKQADFSIHFINSKKLKKNVYGLEKIYGKDHNIVITNELTKKFERKFHGNLQELTEEISNDGKDFTEGIGEMSYLLYKKTKTESSPDQKEGSVNISSSDRQGQESVMEQSASSPYQSININTFIQSLQGEEAGEHGLKPKEKAELVCAVFGIPFNRAKTYVYTHEKFDRKNRK